MKLQQFQNELAQHYNDLIHPSSFTHSQYEPHDLDIPSLHASKYLGHLLNFAVSMLNPNEAHLQLGRVSAGLVAYSIENQSRHSHYIISTDPQVSLLARSQRRPQYRMQFRHFAEPALQILRRKPFFTKQPIGVCYYDPRGNEQEIYLLLHHLLNHLADQAVLIIGGGNQPLVRNFMLTWIELRSDTTLLFDLPTPVPDYKTWDDGVLVIGYQKNS